LSMVQRFEEGLGLQFAKGSLLIGPVAATGHCAFRQ
jgi:hypothetical protein